MKTLAIAVLILSVNLNAVAVVSIWDTLSFADVDPWESVETVEEETITVFSSSFDA